MMPMASQDISLKFFMTTEKRVLVLAENCARWQPVSRSGAPTFAPDIQADSDKHCGINRERGGRYAAAIAAPITIANGCQSQNLMRPR
jgi:hypothetical protein